MIQAIWFAGDFSRHYFIISPSGLASSFPLYQNFSKGASIFCVSIFFTRLLHRPWPLLDIQGPNISLGYTPGRKLKITAFQRGDVWDLYVSLNSDFNTYVDTHSNNSGTKFKCSWGHMCNYCWKMLLNKKQLEFVQQHLHVKRWWTKSPQQKINRTVST